MKITLSKNLSYCFGVKRTLNLVEDLLAKNPQETYYMLGEVVHNEHVIQSLKARGLRVIQDLTEVEPGGTVIIQSHGTPRKTFVKLKEMNLKYLDTTCPMVEVIHRRIGELHDAGYHPIIIGQKGHDEVRGIAGQVPEAKIFGTPDEVDTADLSGIDRAGVVVQSTFILEDAMAILKRIERRIPDVNFLNTICRPTRERQGEVERITGRYECILIVGSKSSANTRHLYNLASGTRSCVYLVDDPETVRELPIDSSSSIFITSGASTPMVLIKRVIEILNERFGGSETKESNIEK